jgi:hypothetical protein
MMTSSWQSAHSRVERFRTDNISNARSRGLRLRRPRESGRRQAPGFRSACYTLLDTEILAVDDNNGAPLPLNLEIGCPPSEAPVFDRRVARLRTILGVPARRRTDHDARCRSPFGTFGGLFDARPTRFGTSAPHSGSSDI